MILLWAALACTAPTPDGADDTSPPADVGDTDLPDAAGDPTIDGDVESVTGLDTDSSVLFNEDEITILELRMTDSAIRDLADEPYEYTQATLVWEGREFGPIGVRTKGENSWRPFREKSSLKLDFNRYDEGPGRFLGLKGLTLNAMNEDASMMHERVAYRVYREAGVPAVRAHHAALYLNGELYGLMVLLDTVDDVWLERWFDDPSGSMWEQHDGDFTDEYVMNNTYFQHEEGDDDRAILEAVADALEGSGDAAVAAADPYLDWDAFHRYWASGSVVMNFDAYPFRFAGDDCHIYHDPTSGKLVYIPHGVDESFYYDDDIEGRARGHIAAKCRESDACRDAWANRVYDVLEQTEASDIAGYAQQVADQIQPWVEEDPNRNFRVSEVAAYQRDMISKIENRRASIRYWIGDRPEG